MPSSNPNAPTLLKRLLSHLRLLEAVVQDSFDLSAPWPRDAERYKQLRERGKSEEFTAPIDKAKEIRNVIKDLLLALGQTGYEVSPHWPKMLKALLGKSGCEETTAFIRIGERMEATPMRIDLRRFVGAAESIAAFRAEVETILSEGDEAP